MKTVIVTVGLVAVLWGLVGAAAAAPPPLAVYGRLPAIEDVQISPNGALLAVSVTDGENRQVLVRKTADNSLVGGMNLGVAKLRDVRWAGDNHVLATVSTTAAVAGLTGGKQEYWLAIDYNVARKKQSPLLEREDERVQTRLKSNRNRTMNVVLGPPTTRMVDGRPLAFVEGIYFPDHEGVRALFRIDLDTGDVDVIPPLSTDTDDWVVDAAGKPMAQSQYDEKTGAWTLRIYNGRTWPAVDTAVSPAGSFRAAGLGRDGASVLVNRGESGGRATLREYGADGVARPLPDDPNFDGLIRDPVSGVLIGGYALVGDEGRHSFFDAKDQATWRTVTNAFKGDRLSLASWSADRRKVVVLADSPSQGPAYAMIDLDAKKAAWLGPLYVGLDETGVSEVRPVAYKARDGLEIHGYLTLPRGRPAKALPLVVLPHGGPAARDVPGFDWWSQALASRGYAVLRPNFRGSDGYGWDLLAAGFGQWGKAMQTDLSDGVAALAAQGLIDPKRVCVVGASYGGYAALAGATLDLGVYRCAAAVAPVADPKSFLIWGQGGYATTQSARLRYWTRFMGVEGTRDPDLTAISPLRQAERATIPILLVHGKDDTVVPYEQSRMMAAALAKSGQPAELVTLAGEDHWLSRGATRLQMLTAVVGFLEKHNPPD